jgi:hypothetical protein
MKKIVLVTILAAAAAALLSCRIDTSVGGVLGDDGPKIPAAAVGEEPEAAGQGPEGAGTPPAATVPLVPYKIAAPKLTALGADKEVVVASDGGAAASLEPAFLTARLKPGESVTEHKTAFLPADLRPPQGDILFSFDLTGSMGGELANVKNNTQNILGAVRSVITDVRFGVVSHMDYPGQFASPGYPLTYYGYPENWMGYGNIGDYPYRLDIPLTDVTDPADMAAVTGAIQNLALGNGADLPESYTRVFHESYADPTVGWRNDAKKILIAWLDSVPHDGDFAEIYSPDLNRTTGLDPGRDALIGDPADPADPAALDNLEILPVLEEMAANNIMLIVIYSNADTPVSIPPYYSSSDYWGTGFPLWQKYAEITGGTAFKINTDGSIPGGVAIGDFIAGLITEQVGHIDTLGLEVRDPAYAGWLTEVSPAHTGIDLDEDASFPFDITITVPPGTPSGEHSFSVALVGDGVVYAEQQVTITVYDTVEVLLDIKPGSCPNPLNVRSNGVLPAAIAGSAALDAATIDPATIRLAGVAPLRWNLEDVTSPGDGSCGRSGPDGIPDLTLKFDTRAIVSALGDVNDGDIVTVGLTGALKDGTGIAGGDSVKIIKKK